MGRGAGVLNLAQGLAWGIAAAWLSPAWTVAGLLAGGVALIQLLYGGALLLGRAPRVARLVAALTLAGAAALAAMYLQAAFFIAASYGAEAKDVAMNGLGTALLALPWLIGASLWQLFAGREQGGPAGPAALGLTLLAGGMGWGGGALASQPSQTWPAQPSRAEAARVAFARWTGQGAADALPVGDGAATVLLTPWLDGRPGTSIRGDGADLGAAVQAALDGLPAPDGARPALVLDVARAVWPGTQPLGPQTGALSEDSGRSPTTLWRPKQVERAEIRPGIRAPMVTIEGDATRFDSVLVDAEGPRALVHGWTPAPALTAEVAREAALAGGRMLVRHQDSLGRYAYIVAGPSGKELGGYNFPRHAGVTWFLARLAERTEAPDVIASVALGLSYLERSSTVAPVGGSYVRDPSRPDRKVWVGTTALAALAAVSAKHPMAVSWGRFVAASVDAEGQVRGDLDLDLGAFPPQPLNTYGQGQAMLALASLVRAGHTEFEAPLLRAQRYVEGDYARGAAGRLIVLDEHWACLAALAGREATGQTAGWEICRAYVHDAALLTPTAGSSVHLSTGAAGGLAEAVVAAAFLDTGGPWAERALAYAQLFVRSAYEPGDAPLLERPEALLGGFRDSAADWDVRMDAVQHIGCALLGAEAILTARAPGSLP